MLLTDQVEALWALKQADRDPQDFHEQFRDFIAKNTGVRGRIAVIGPRAANTLNKFDRMLADFEATEREIETARELEIKTRREEEIRIQRLARRQRALFVQNIAQPLFANRFLEADDAFKEAILIQPQRNFSEAELLEEFEQQKIRFIQQWFTTHGTVNAHGIRDIPDTEQALAIGTIGDAVQVVARAGSGKTSTIANRAFFLLRHCQVPASTMLLIAFNRKAVVELRKRLLTSLLEDGHQALDQQLKLAHRRTPTRKPRLETIASAIDAVAERQDLSLPHVLTFHALAYALVHPEDSILFDGPQEADGQTLSRTVQQIIDDHLRSASHREQVRKLMVAHFKADWERIVTEGFDRSKEEFLAYRRALPNQAINGEYLKSYGEKVIADFLFQHDVEYKYERNHWWNGLNYRPDFTVFATPTSGAIIEYFGLAGDPDYDEMSEAKRRYWSTQPEWELIEIYPEQLSTNNVNSLHRRLSSTFARLGITLRPLTEEEIWLRIKDRAIDRFTKAVVGFIGRCRKLSLAPGDLLARRRAFRNITPLESQFVDLVHLIYDAYLDRIKATGEDDFDGLMQRASVLVKSGRTIFQRRRYTADLRTLQHIFIDEYQDFSRLFHDLITAIRDVNPSARLFCVGDDWQAINGFAGADLVYFHDFDKQFASTTRRYISTNYRSGSTIVEIGNSLMNGLGKPARSSTDRSGQVLLADLEEFRPSLLEQQQHPGDAITPAVARLIAANLRSDNEVVLLARRNGLPWFVNYGASHNFREPELESFLTQVRSKFPEPDRNRISISTVHKYKGLEKTTVIVLDAVARSYPLVHPDWVFMRVLGDSIEAIVEEERRLFYVALTRAIEKLILVSSERNRCSFIEQLRVPVHIRQFNRSVLDRLRQSNGIMKLDWDFYPPPKNEDGRVVIGVGNDPTSGTEGTYGVKDLLKAAGYRWRSTGWKSWQKSMSTKDFSLDRLRLENWASDCRGVEVRVYDESETIIESYRVDRGHWECIAK